MAEEIRVPDIGDFDKVEIIEVLVSAGDSVEAETPLIALESDKASMEVPSPKAGKVVEVKVKVGEQVGQGDVILTLEAADAEDESDEKESAPAKDEAEGDETEQAEPESDDGEADDEEQPSDKGPKKKADKAAGKTDSGETRQEPQEAEQKQNWGKGPVDHGPRRSPPVPFDAHQVKPDQVPHASPAVRRFARELGVPLEQVKGSGRHGRIVKSDIEGFVKHTMQAGGGAPGVGLDLLDWPKVDFAKFGKIEETRLSRIKKISGANLSRNWVMIPHVTQHDEADITEMEAFRKSHAEDAKKQGFKLTPLAFLIKACVAALKAFPQVNASLAADGETLVLKKYFHIGVAVDTPDGLVVPVIRDCDKKSLYELADEVVAASEKARDRKLSPSDMQGGCFSISSLGGIGGTYFTPIINAPEVAILGVSRSYHKPVWDGTQFEPRLMLPLSLSYDHRVVDGAQAARFTSYLGYVLSDLRRLLL